MGVNERPTAIEAREVLLLLAFLFHLMYGDPAVGVLTCLSRTDS